LRKIRLPIRNKAFQLLNLICAFGLLSVVASGQVVDKVKGKAVLITLQGQTLAVDSQWVTVNDVGRKTGLVKIKAVKGDKAVADLMAGTAVAGESLIPRPPPKSRFKDDGTGQPPPDQADNPDGAAPEEPSPTGRSKKRMGVELGYAMDSFQFSSNGFTSSQFSGTGENFQGFFDINLTQSLNVRLLGGYDIFNAADSSGNSISVSSLGGGGDLQWRLYQKGNNNAFIGVGIVFEYVMSATLSSGLSNALQKPSNISSFVLSAGGDYALKKKLFIPYSIGYHSYLAGSGVTQTAIVLTGGIGWLY